MREILNVLGISKEDIDRFPKTNKRRFRSFLRKGKTLQRISKRKRDLPGLYYNIAYGWTSKELHREYNCIIDKTEEEEFRKSMIRVEYVCKFGSKQKKSVYVDAREMVTILQEMGYDIKRNAKYLKFIDKEEETI